MVIPKINSEFLIIIEIVANNPGDVYILRNLCTFSPINRPVGSLTLTRILPEPPRIRDDGNCDLKKPYVIDNFTKNVKNFNANNFYLFPISIAAVQSHPAGIPKDISRQIAR